MMDLGVKIVAERNGDIDFWRGFVLVTILVNHIPGNILEHLTFRNLGFSDSAEAFIFISGLSLAMIYYPRLPAGDFLGVARRCLTRALQLYRVHLALTFAVIAMAAVSYVLSDAYDVLVQHGRGTVFADTARAVTGIVLLGHQLGYFNILPLYIVLMIWAPVVLVLARLHVALALGVSVFVYGLARVAGLTMPSWPEPGSWFFNPFAWQFLFTLGIVAGIVWREGVPASRRLSALAWAIVAAAFVVVTDGFGLAPGLWGGIGPYIDTVKQDQGLGRAVHFLALAYLVAHLRIAHLFRGTVLEAELTRLGRHGLEVFAAGSLLSALGQLLMTLASVKRSASPELIGMVCTILGIAALMMMVRYLEWAKSSAKGKVPVPAQASGAMVSAPARSSSALPGPRL